MKFTGSYLQMVLVPAPATRLAERFQRRSDAIHGEAADNTRKTTPLSPLQVEAALARIETQLITASVEENEREIILLIGQTDIHTQWWKRLKVVNESRDSLARIARQSAHWAAIVERLTAIVATPQVEREDARNRFLNEVAPLFTKSGQRVREVYPLAQKYGDKHAFEALMSRLLVDVPEIYQLEKIFFEKFNAHVTGGLSIFRESVRIPRARYCPLPESPPVPFPYRRAIAGGVILLLAIVLLSRR